MDEMDKGKDHIFVMYVQQMECAKALKFAQGRMARSIVKNMVGDNIQKQDDGKYIVLVDRGTKEECEKMEKEFWEQGSVNLQDSLKDNIENSRLTPRFMKNKFKKLTDKSEKVKTYFDAISTAFGIVTTTHILPEMSLEELEKYFRENFP